MRARSSSWAEVKVGSYFKDAQDLTRRVVDERAGWIKTVGADKTTATFQRPAPTTPVTLLEPTHDDAVAVAEKVLGAEEIVTHSKARGALAPAFPKTIRGLDNGKSHIRLLHGTYVEDVKDMKGLIEAHEDLHGRPGHKGWIEHRHRDK